MVKLRKMAKEKWFLGKIYDFFNYLLYLDEENDIQEDHMV